MSDKKETRKNAVLNTVDIDEERVDFKKQEKLDFSKALQIPTYQYITERYLSIANEYPYSIDLEEVTVEVLEVCKKINIVTKTRTNLKILIRLLYCKIYY